MSLPHNDLRQLPHGVGFHSFSLTVSSGVRIGEGSLLALAGMLSQLPAEVRPLPRLHASNGRLRSAEPCGTVLA
jgi:hypothetical protein